ncbi:MAG: hypothetical protein HYZ13_05895 [Acidobacteria bacterium]|nr:hypothetical protein [Acidobacteriota bacterium]
MPNILKLPQFRPKSPREFRIATPREFITSWLSWVAVFSLLYLVAFRLGMLPNVLRIRNLPSTTLQVR